MVESGRLRDGIESQVVSCLQGDGFDRCGLRKHPMSRMPTHTNLLYTSELQSQFPSELISPSYGRGNSARKK
jgi:hypothetical protein